MDSPTKFDLESALYSEEPYSFYRLPCVFSESNQIETQLAHYLVKRLYHDENIHISICDMYDVDEREIAGRRERYIARYIARDRDIFIQSNWSDDSNHTAERLKVIRGYKINSIEEPEKPANLLSFGMTNNLKTSQLIMFNFASYLEINYIRNNLSFDQLSPVEDADRTVIGVPSTMSDMRIHRLSCIMNGSGLAGDFAAIARIFGHKDYKSPVTVSGSGTTFANFLDQQLQRQAQKLILNSDFK